MPGTGHEKWKLALSSFTLLPIPKLNVVGSIPIARSKEQTSIAALNEA
jgi:hypothetical protein